MSLTREELIKQYKKIHTEKHYGYTSQNLLYLLLPFVKELAPKTILDYGCGQSDLVNLLRKELDPQNKGLVTAYKYEPAIEEHSILPVTSADLVINTDVLEHIPTKDLEEVIKKIISISNKAIFIICNKKAIETLDDGSNAHCSVYPPQWWLDVIRKEAGFAKLVPWPVKSTCCILTWDSQAVKGLPDLLIKYITGKIKNFLK